MKKLLSLVAASALTFSMAACGSNDNGSNTTDQGGDTAQAPSSQVAQGAIDVVSREAGSGTRSAFEEIIGFNGEGQDPLTANATIKDGNGVVATYVEGNDSSIGYVSFVTLEENHGKINGLTVEGVEPTAENVLEGKYSVARPFEMVYMEENITDVERAFIDFVSSTEGLEILESKGTIVDKSNAESFDPSKYSDLSGNIVMGGSTSTEQAVKALADEFKALFPKVTYTYDSTGSGAGVKNATSGTYTLGFASREIKDSELEAGITTATLCMDGIALVVNPSNNLTDISKEQIKDVYTGNITEWSELTK